MQTAVFTLIILTVGLLTLALQFLAIVNLFNRENSEIWGGNRWSWLILILLTNLIGSTLYLVVNQRRLEQSREQK